MDLLEDSAFRGSEIFIRIDIKITIGVAQKTIEGKLEGRWKKKLKPLTNDGQGR